MDSDHLTNRELRHRSQIIDAQRRGLFIIMTDLKLEDTGVYWVGIDKIHADIMTSINLIVTFGKIICALYFYWQFPLPLFFCIIQITSLSPSGSVQTHGMAPEFNGRHLLGPACDSALC